MNLGASELFLVLVVILLLFGGKRLPETARQLGRGIHDLRRSYLDIKREVSEPFTQPHTTQSTANKQSLNAPPNTQPRTDSEEPPQAS
ncbi:MAG: twin-arginine translocase TatA/TatE family subunit [Calditrichaeota bacterium]|nr:twin-arginine translocase TatA/TatE family subunit [Calditrichota bacterium]MCB9368257.1 twin-arginine translocase TatA/TatE family subunit [Calditrichota bacterium]